MALCFLCVIFIFYDSYEANRLFGDFFGFVTAIFVGASSVVIRYAKIVNFLPSLLLGKLFTSLIALLFIQSIYLDGIDLYLIIIMGVFLVTLPLTFLTLAPRYIPAYEVQLFFILETALGPLWVWLVINEEPTIKTIIGGVLIVLTVFVHTLVELKEQTAK
jgi:drug/metabolite transporter (DMT)-like permease